MMRPAPSPSPFIPLRGATPRPWLACLVAVLLLPFAPLAQAAASAEEQQAFFGELLTSMMQRHEIPGLAAVMVQGDQTLFTVGYGWANVAQQVRVEPERTVFLFGSVSKVLTSVAVLQLVDAGAIDLDADVTRYVEQVPADSRFAAPITMRHLLTHTDGFDVRWLFGGAARVPSKVEPLSVFLQNLPPRVMPPGELYLYSDVGLTLAGHIVERLSEQPFADYMERRVFAPLNMDTASFHSERKSYARDRATGYELDDHGRLRPVPVVYPRATPASGLTATIKDMAPLMSALLQSGRLGSTSILSEAATAELWRRQFSHHPAIPGTGFGCYEYYHRGRRAMVHGGLLPGFTSVVIFLPDVGVGLCVVANRFDLVGPLENDLVNAIVERFQVEPTGPATLPRPPSALAGLHTDVTQLAGVYRCDQYSRHSLDKLFVLAGLATEFEVKPQPDGSLQFEPDRGRWVEIEPRLFENDESGERVLFQTDEAGRGSRIVGSAQFMSYHRVDAIDVPRNTLALSCGLVLFACLGAIRGVRAKWRARYEQIPPSIMLQWLRWLAILLPLLALAFGAGFWDALVRLDFVTAAFGEPSQLSMVRQLPVVFGLLALGQILLAIVELLVSGLSNKEPFVYAFAGAAVLLLLPILNHWNLIKLPFAG